MYCLMLVAVVASLLFFFGGNDGVHEVGGDVLPVPAFTNTFLNVCYAFTAIAVVLTLCAVCYGYASKAKNDPKGAGLSLIPLALFVLLFVICWFLGDPSEMKIIGYEGHDNVGFWAQATDMIIYGIYSLVAITVLAIICGAVYGKIQK
jgi:Zn-dependent protease with chaperone function